MPFVPGGPPAASLVNLDNLLAQGWRGRGSATLTAYVDTRDPATLARVTAGLAEKGIAVSATTHADDVAAAYGRSAAAWSLQLALAVGILSLLVAAAGIVVLASTSRRARSRDYAVLRLVGQRPRSLRLLAQLETLPVIVVSALLGAAVGLWAAPAAVGMVPLFTTRRRPSPWTCGRRGLPRSSPASWASSSSPSSASSPAGGSLGGPTSSGSGRPYDPAPGDHHPRARAHLPVRGAGRRRPVRRRPQRHRRRGGRAARAVGSGQVDPARPPRRPVPPECRQDLRRRARAVGAHPDAARRLPGPGDLAHAPGRAAQPHPVPHGSREHRVRSGRGAPARGGRHRCRPRSGPRRRDGVRRREARPPLAGSDADGRSRRRHGPVTRGAAGRRADQRARPGRPRADPRHPAAGQRGAGHDGRGRHPRPRGRRPPAADSDDPRRPDRRRGPQRQGVCGGDGGRVHPHSRAHPRRAAARAPCCGSSERRRATSSSPRCSARTRVPSRSAEAELSISAVLVRLTGTTSTRRTRCRST